MTIRILTQLNFSAGENPEGDSGLRFTCELIYRLQQATDRFYFYILVPTRAEGVARERLHCRRLSILPVEVPPRLHGGDFAFNPVALAKAFDFRRFDVDVLFLNQPELVAAYKNFFNRQTFHLVPAFTYVHWFDVRRPGTPKDRTHHPALLAAAAGIVSSDAVGCNSVYGREIILGMAERWLKPELLTDLRRSIRVLPPPISADRIMRGKKGAGRWSKKLGTATLLINHRLLKYTGVRQLLEAHLPKIWHERQDFEVILTNPSRARLPGALLNQPWARNGTLPDDDYFARLWSADIVLAPHRATHWSISTLEAVAAGCLPICNREGFFLEMFDPVLARMTRVDRERFRHYCLYFRQELPKKINHALDDLQDLADFRAGLAKATRSVFRWDAQLAPWISMFEDLYEQVPEMGAQNPTVAKLRQLLRAEPGLSKDLLLRRARLTPKDRTISWTSIRKTLRSDFVDDSEGAELRLWPCR